MNNTYVVYTEEYYFSLNTFSSLLRKKVYNISYNKESAEEIKELMEESLQELLNSSDINSNNEILTTYKIEIICLDGILSFDDARAAVINDDYTWGKVGHGR